MAFSGQAIARRMLPIKRLSLYIHRFIQRTCGCGQINSALKFKEVTLCGWLRRKRMSIFGLIYDATGQCQFVVNCRDLISVLESIPLFSVIQVVGQVKERPNENINQTMSTGKYEIATKSIKLINKCDIPILSNHLSDQLTSTELVKNRFMAFRSSQFHNIMKKRSDICFDIRCFFRDRNFIEIDTPKMVNPSSGGANEFRVTSNINKYIKISLAQSPQMYKQLLVIGGIDRYFQLATCFRDERLKSHRQFEFTQIDFEMAYADEQTVQQIVEDMITRILTVNIKFVRLTYDVSLDFFKTDKPNVLHVRDICPRTKLNRLRVLGVNDDIPLGLSGCNVGFIGNNGDSTIIYGHLHDNWTDELKHCPNSMLVLSEEKIDWNDDMRNTMIWIVERPLYKISKNKLVSDHHPFTAPKTNNYVNDITSRARSFDLVWCGVEIGGGSVRIISEYDQKIVIKDMLKYELQPFQQLLKALKSGAPPHAGFALGLDRFLQIYFGTESIRDVVAFPRTGDGVLY
ncbi:hypothetical protein GJ496_007643 [Pomphorhynchus laevis]|nr:hypothetical protein GJ496_007643 [Pomphorhynchus laevis]